MGGSANAPTFFATDTLDFSVRGLTTVSAFATSVSANPDGQGTIVRVMTVLRIAETLRRGKYAQIMEFVLAIAVSSAMW